MDGVKFYLSERNRLLASGDLNDNQLAYLTQLMHQLSPVDRAVVRETIRISEDITRKDAK